MKDKILTLIIGILIGAILAAGGFLIYNNVSGNNQSQPEMMQMNGNGDQANGDNSEMGDPPSKPDGDDSEEPPSKPDDSNTTNSTDSKSNSTTKTNDTSSNS